MPETAHVDVTPASEVAHTVSTQSASNGIRYGSYGDIQIAASDLSRLVEAVPQAIAAALHHKTYFFVPLTLGESFLPEPAEVAPESGPDRVMIASEFSTELSDAAICHRNASVDGMECVFISTRLMQDRFALAFEFYINAGHHFVDAAGVPETFMSLAWTQATAGIRGETSQDAWESRMKAGAEMNQTQPENQSSGSRAKSRRLRPSPAIQTENERKSPLDRNAVDEKARNEYFGAAFADAVAIYLLSLTVDFDYAELREREYPLLAAPALAERLRHVAQLFPPNSGYEFSVRYRRRDRIGA